MNIPHDRAYLKAKIRTARASFTGRNDPARRHYMFVLETVPEKQLVGTCTIYAQHGHPETPHVFFDVIDDERYSSTLNRHFSHLTLRLGFNYRGPTEIGALVLHPDYRAFGWGRCLSFGRFLFIAMYRDRFQSNVIAELMPPLEADGRSLLWEHLGRHFTGLGYQEADKLSHKNKEFIYALFPQTPLYASLLPDEIRCMIGEVGPETRGVRRMLEDVGFRYSHRIDPFDGGPHFEADTDRITPVQEARRLRVSSKDVSTDVEDQILQRKVVPGFERRLIGVGDHDGPTRFRAAVGAVAVEGGYVVLSKETRAMLKVHEGDDAWVTVL
ncbi:MAG: arginine N-succinyltransferase [Myxococcales bacterium]|nr:arginine N-succinyltransferase [Myxococcales bacterium]